MTVSMVLGNEHCLVMHRQPLSALPYLGNVILGEGCVRSNTDFGTKWWTPCYLPFSMWSSAKPMLHGILKWWITLQIDCLGLPCQLQSFVYGATECTVGYGYDALDYNLYKIEKLEYFKYLPIDQENSKKKNDSPADLKQAVSIPCCIFNTNLAC